MLFCSFLWLHTLSHARLTRIARGLLNKVKPQNMSATTDLKACLILELLGSGVPDGSVDYQCGDGRHRFVVWCQGLRYELSFLEPLLDACSAEDITNVVRIVVERIHSRSAPRRMKFGAIQPAFGPKVERLPAYHSDGPGPLR